MLFEITISNLYLIILFHQRKVVQSIPLPAIYQMLQFYLFSHPHFISDRNDMQNKATYCAQNNNKIETIHEQDNFIYSKII